MCTVIFTFNVPPIFQSEKLDAEKTKLKDDFKSIEAQKKNLQSRESEIKTKEKLLLDKEKSLAEKEKTLEEADRADSARNDERTKQKTDLEKEVGKLRATFQSLKEATELMTTTKVAVQEDIKRLMEKKKELKSEIDDSESNYNSGTSLNMLSLSRSKFYLCFFSELNETWKC